MDIFGSTPAQPQPAPSMPAQSDNNLMDVFGGGMTPSAPSGMPGGDIFGQPQQSYVQIFEDGSIKIECTMNRNPMNPQEHQIKVFFSNKASSAIDNVSLQVAVQKYMKLTLSPISSSRCEAGSQRAVTQDMQIANSEDGKKPLAIKIKV